MSQSSSPSQGPLSGVRVLEFAGIGPGPYCAMLLSDLGADVVRIDRPGGNGWPNPVVDRGRARLDLDVRTDEGRALCLAAAAEADAIIEGFRPGVMERLGLGPDHMLARNPRLVYGRMTGWGQDGPLAKVAGHDINYIALTGALDPIGAPGHPPPPPLNLVGDFGGGSLFLALGIVSALFERDRSGLGQVVDAAIIDGASSMMAMFDGLPNAPGTTLERGKNLLSGAGPFYRCYTCADGRDIAIGPLEPHFFKILLERIGAPDNVASTRAEPSQWAERSGELAAIFATKTRAEWCDALEGTDACFAPVLTRAEAPLHPHNAARGGYITRDGRTHPAPAPRFSRTPSEISENRDGRAALESWGVAIN